MSFIMCKYHKPLCYLDDGECKFRFVTKYYQTRIIYVEDETDVYDYAARLMIAPEILKAALCWQKLLLVNDNSEWRAYPYEEIVKEFMTPKRFEAFLPVHYEKSFDGGWLYYCWNMNGDDINVNDCSASVIRKLADKCYAYGQATYLPEKEYLKAMLGKGEITASRYVKKIISNYRNALILPSAWVPFTIISAVRMYDLRGRYAACWPDLSREEIERRAFSAAICGDF